MSPEPSKSSYTEAISKGIQRSETESPIANVLETESDVEQPDATRDEESTDSKPEATDSATNPLLEDIDFSTVPEDIREKVKQATLSKVEKYDRKFNRDNQEFSRLRKLQSSWNSLPVDKQDRINKLISGQESAEPQPARRATTEQKQMSRRVDQLIDNTTDPQARESLRDLKQIIAEEAGTDGLANRIGRIEQLLTTFLSTQVNSRSATLGSDIDKLEESFASSLIEKHRHDIAQAGKGNTKTAKKLLFEVANPDEIEAARLPKKAASKQSQANRPAATVTQAKSVYDESQKKGPEKAKTWDIGSIIRGKRQQAAAGR